MDDPFDPEKWLAAPPAAPAPIKPAPGNLDEWLNAPPDPNRPERVAELAPKIEQSHQWASLKNSDAPVSVMGVPGWNINLGKEVGSETLGGVGYSVKDALRGMVPYSEFQGKVDEKRYGEAVKARDNYLTGKSDESPSDADLGRIAEYEFDQQREAARSQRSKIAVAALGVPKIVGEFATGGPIMKGIGGVAGLAAASPLITQGYLEKSQRNANKNGGNWYDPENVALPLAENAVQAVVLGQIGKFANSEAVAGTASTALGRFAAKSAVAGAAMPVESAAAEVLTGGVQDALDEAGFGKYLDPKEDRYKTFRDALAGKWGDVGTKLATDAILGAGFAAFHGKESRAVEEAQKQIEKLPESSKLSEKPTEATSEAENPSPTVHGEQLETPDAIKREMPAPAEPTAPEAAGQKIARPEQPQEAESAKKGLSLGNSEQIDQTSRGLDPAEQNAVRKFGTAYRVELNLGGDKVGKVLMAEEGDTIHIPWAEKTGLAGGEGRGNPPFGAREMIRIGRQLADIYPEMNKLVYTPSEGRIRAGEVRVLDLSRYRSKESQEVNDATRTHNADVQNALRSGYSPEAVARSASIGQEAANREAGPRESPPDQSGRPANPQGDQAGPPEAGSPPVPGTPGGEKEPPLREAVAAALSPDPKTTGRGVLRANLAKEAHANAVGEEALKAGVDIYDTGIAKARGDENALTDNFLHFADPIETGDIAKMDPKVRDIAWAVRRLNNEMQAELTKRGMLKDDSLIEDYLGHQWLDPKDPNATPQQIGERLSKARRPFEGSKGFQKERTLPTYADGFRAGLTPKDWNPVRSVLAKRAEVAKAIMAHDVAAELEERGLWKFVKLSDRPPPEWEQVNDKIASVFYRTKEGVGPVLAGHYYTPKEIAKDINNHLSPGLYGQSKLYDVTRGAANVLNQFQLGFSAFHAGFVTMDAMVSSAALGVKMLSRGDVGPALKQFAKTPLAPLLNYLRGTKIGREYFKPGSQGADIAATVAALDEAGGRARMDAFYGGTHFDAFRKAVEQVRYGNLGKVPTVFGRALPALSDVFSKPIMEKLVPRMKMGVFADMAKYELSKLNNPSVDQVRSVLGKSWDSVENRLGQMTYDNLFWNRTFKDSLMLGVRSVGWNLGTIRELGGGAKDIPKSVKGLVQGEGVTDRTAYVVALPMIAAAWGAIYGYLNGNPPKDWRDMINPRTGRKNPDGTDERVALPSYMRDLMSLTNRWEEGPVRIAQNAYQMARHKLNPLIGLTAEMLENKDFYNTAIVDPKDSTLKQAQDEALHVLAAFEPLAVKQALGAGGKKPTDQQRAEGFIGITPAPYAVTHTTAQQEAADEKKKIEFTPLAKKRAAEKKK